MDHIINGSVSKDNTWGVVNIVGLLDESQVWKRGLECIEKQ